MVSLLDRIFGPLRRARAVPASQGDSIVTRAQPSQVPREYRPLFTYLHDRYAQTVVLTFGEMESLLGFALPPAAMTRPEWWTDSILSAARHACAWTEAERQATPNLVARRVTFERI